MMVPLNCIISFADTLTADLSDPRQLRMASLIKKTTKILKMNLRDLLDRNLLERGIFEPNFDPVRLKDLLKEVSEIMNFHEGKDQIKTEFIRVVECKYFLDS